MERILVVDPDYETLAEITSYFATPERRVYAVANAQQATSLLASIPAVPDLIVVGHAAAELLDYLSFGRCGPTLPVIVLFEHSQSVYVAALEARGVPVLSKTALQRALADHTWQLAQSSGLMMN